MNATCCSECHGHGTVYTAEQVRVDCHRCVCHAIAHGFPACDDAHKANGSACSVCDPRTAEERGVMAIPFDS